MGDKLKDLTGLTFGYWKVLRRAENKGKRAMWLCKCVCGKEKVIQGTSLKSGLSKSCGCKKSENHFKTHGLANHPLYAKWLAIRHRCKNPHNHKYKNYGGKGITVCSEWDSDFELFYEWALSNGYKEGLELDRIDNTKGYSPENCRFVTHKENLRNMERTILVTINGKTAPLIEWCEKLNLKYLTVYSRIKHYGWTPEKALLTPIRKHKEYER